MDRLLTMSTFVKVVQHGSFAAAASDMGISRALISRHIADLEKHLGARLLNRTTRSVALTEAGQLCYKSCLETLGEVQGLEDAVKNLSSEVEGNISIIAPKWVGYLEVSTALAQFCRLYPKIKMQFTLGGMSTKTHNFLERGFDVAFLTKKTPDSQIRVKKIADISYVTIASKGYLDQYGLPLHPNDLETHSCLTQSSDPIWRFRSNGKIISIRVGSRFSSNSYSVLCMAALKELGVAVVPKRVANEFSKRGELQQILQPFILEDRPLYAAYSPGNNLPKKVRALLTFLGDWFRDHPLH